MLSRLQLPALRLQVSSRVINSAHAVARIKTRVVDKRCLALAKYIQNILLKLLNCLSSWSLGKGTLFVPPGTWMTGPFNLTSNMTLFLANGATIQGSTNMSEWPLMPAMSSYGQGRDHPGPRHVSLLHGFNLHGLTIGGENGTVDGGGPFWWHRHRSRQEKYTRGHLFECMNCTDLLFQDVTFTNSPFWTVHTVFSQRVVARRLTVLNDHYSPNTDGKVVCSQTS